MSMPLGGIETGARAIGDWILRVRPSLEGPVLRAWYLYVRARVRGVALKQTLTHEAPVRPFEVVWVEPGRVTQILPPFPRSKFEYAGRVMGGDWDRACVPFCDTDVYRAFESHFERGVDWRETAFYDRVVDEIAAGREMWGCRSREEFDERCERLDALYASIDDQGFKAQRELHDADGEEAAKKYRSSATERLVQDEMAIGVGRGGELLFIDGRDRLAIAKLLDVDEIPAWILVRHERWQELRDAVAAGALDPREFPARLRDHPDLPHADSGSPVGSSADAGE